MLTLTDGVIYRSRFGRTGEVFIRDLDTPLEYDAPSDVERILGRYVRRFANIHECSEWMYHNAFVFGSLTIL